MIITRIRASLQSPVFKGFMLLLMLSFFGFGIVGVGQKFFTGGSDGVITVNGYGVSAKFFERKKHEAQEQINTLYKQYGQAAEMIMRMQGQDFNPEKFAYASSVRTALLNQVADSVPVYLSAEYIKTKLQDPYFLIPRLRYLMPSDVVTQDQRINIDSFNRFLAETNLEEFTPDLIDTLRQDIVTNVIASSVWFPEFMNKDLYTNRYAKKKFIIHTFSFDLILKEETAKGASQEELKAFFDEQNKKNKRYVIPAKRNGTKWFFEQKNFELSVSDKELEAYYTKVKHSRFVESQAQVTIREIIFDEVAQKGLLTLKEEADAVHAQAVQDPSTFAELAKKHSSFKVTAAKGGLVEIAKRGEKDSAVERTAFALKTDGDISPVIKLAKGGYAIIQRQSRKNATYKPFEKVKEEIRSSLLEKKFATAFTRRATQALRASEKEVLSSFIEKNKGKEEKVAAVAQKENTVGARLFSLKKSGDKIAYISEGKGIILELGDILKKEVPPFEILESYIKKDFYEVRAAKAVQAKIKEARLELLAGKAIKAAPYSKSHTTGFVDLSKEEEVKALLNNDIPQEALYLDKVGGVLALSGKKDGYVVQLDSVKNEEKAEEAQAQKNEFKAGITGEFVNLSNQAFIASLQRNATIITNTTIEPKSESYEI